MQTVNGLNNFKDIKTTENNIKEMKSKNVLAFTFSEIGAMGVAGELSFYTKNECYHINAIEDPKLFNKYFSEYYSLIRLFGYKKLKNNSLYRHIDLGMGNHMAILNELHVQYTHALNEYVGRESLFDKYLNVLELIIYKNI